MWAFVVSGYLEGIQHYDGYLVSVRNLRTNTVIEARVRGNYFAAATADLNYRSVVELGDTLELTVSDTLGNIVSEKFSFTVNTGSLANARSERDAGWHRHPETEPLIAELSEPL